MKAIVEIKLNKKIIGVPAQNPGTKFYEDVIDQILVDDGYEVIAVSPYYGDLDSHNDFKESNLENVTFVSLVIDLEKKQIEDFKKYDHDIIGLVLDDLGDKYMAIIDVSSDDE